MTPAAVVVLASAVSLILRVRSPLWIRADYLFDDGLFAQLAGSIARGNWLGGFSGRTLAKGPAYPIFIAASDEAHIPLAVAEQLLYLCAAGVVCVALGWIAHSRWFGVTAYVALALSPVHLGAAGSVITREIVYTSLAVLTLGATLLMLRAVPSLVRVRRGAGFVALAAGGVVIGATGAAYYLCREERAWLAPAFLVVVGAGLWSCRGRIAPLAVRVCAGLLVLGLAAIAAFFGGVHAVSQRNARAYGVSIVSDLADGQFARAYSLWQSVEASPPRTHIPVPEAARRAVYAVSPAAAQMEVALDTPTGAARHWARFSNRGDYIGAFFVWALRDAAQAAGHFGTETDFQSYFKQVADQIQAACHAGRLRCGRQGLPVLPAVTSADLPVIANSARETMAYLLTFDVADPHRAFPSGGQPGIWQAATRAIPQAQNQALYQRNEKRALRGQWPVSVLESVYHWLAYPAAIMAVLALIWEFIRPRPRGRALAWALLGILTALLCRVLVVALVDALSYTAAHNVSYALPGSDLLVLFCAAGTFLFIAKTVDLVRTEDALTEEMPDVVSVQ